MRSRHSGVCVPVIFHQAWASSAQSRGWSLETHRAGLLYQPGLVALRWELLHRPSVRPNHECQESWDLHPGNPQPNHVLLPGMVEEVALAQPAFSPRPPEGSAQEVAAESALSASQGRGTAKDPVTLAVEN